MLLSGFVKCYHYICTTMLPVFRSSPGIMLYERDPFCNSGMTSYQFVSDSMKLSLIDTMLFRYMDQY